MIDFNTIPTLTELALIGIKKECAKLDLNLDTWHEDAMRPVISTAISAAYLSGRVSAIRLALRALDAFSKLYTQN